jgi:hypothetical protein
MGKRGAKVVVMILAMVVPLVFGAMAVFDFTIVSPKWDPLIIIGIAGVFFFFI